MPDYYLPSHVHFCWRGDSAVFCDLRQDDFTLVNGNRAVALRNLAMRQAEIPALETSEALEELVEAGLLTMDREAGRNIAPTRVELAMEPLVDPEAPARTRIELHHVWRFISACLLAAVQLRFNKVEKIVAAVEWRKRRCASTTSVDIAKGQQLTEVFLRIRSLFPRNYLCFYDSLALIEFLAVYEIYPTWVFGVRLEPWGAHCWVQEGRFVFNEGVEEAAAYTPVMAI